MTDFSEDFIIPEEKTVKGYPNKLANENAFYASELNSDSPLSVSSSIAHELESRGASPIHSEALELWKQHQEITNREAVKEVISDPEMDINSKLAIVRQYEEGQLSSTNLRDQYIERIASEDTIPWQEEYLRTPDIEAQEIFLDTIRRGLEDSDALQSAKTAFASGLNPSVTSVVGGMLLDFVSPLDLHSIRSFHNAQNLGVNVTTEDVVDSPFARYLMSPVGRAAFEAIDNSLFDVPRSILFNGTLNRKVADLYENSSPEEQKQILDKIFESMEDIPGTDFNKFLVFQEQIEDPLQHPAALLGADALGILATIPLFQAIRSPIQTLKWYTTFKGAGAAKKVGQQTPNTKAEEPVTPDNIPTGSGEVNATDDVLSSTEDIGEQLTKREKPLRADKIYTQSEKAKSEGSVIIDAKASELERGIDRLIEEASRKKKAGIAFDKNKNVEVARIKVDDKGKVSFLDGIETYSVMRERGMRDIPLSMDAESILNAQKAGYINRVVSQDTVFDVKALTRLSRPSVAPNSPAGTTAKANPVEAANRYTDAMADATGDVARHMGTTRGEIISDSVLPKLDISLSETFPNIYKRIQKIDETFNEILSKPEAQLLDVPGRRQREKEVDLAIKAFKDVSEGTYNQANSTVHIGRGKAEGIATFGRTDDYGWATREQAEFVAEKLREKQPDFPTRVVERNGTHWIEQEWEHSFYHIDRWMFGTHSMDSSLLGINTSGLTRTKLGSWLFPNTMKGNPDFAKEGFLSELKANKEETAFFSLIRKEIMDVKHKKELNAALNFTQEKQIWLQPEDFDTISQFSHLTKQQKEEVARGYYMYKRGSDYAYSLANRLHRKELDNAGMKGLYDDVGNLLGFAKETSRPDVKEVFDFDLGKPVRTPNELDRKKYVTLHEPINIEGRIFRHGVIGKQEVRRLPHNTLPKIEGWVPRKNIENWYIDFRPSRMTIDGAEVTDENTLRNYSKTVGAGSTRKEAQAFADQLATDFPDGNLVVREAKENIGDNTLADYQIYSDSVRNARKRGDRLRTINGNSRLEDPLEAFSQTIRSLTRMNAWADFKDSFEDSFTKFAGKYFHEDANGQKVFPNEINGLDVSRAISPEEKKEFAVAQRLLEQYKGMQYSATNGDVAWQSVFNRTANILEEVGFAGKEMAELSRVIGKQGFIPVRAAKSLTTNLFINLNPPRQWIIQPQQLLELNAISPTYAKRAPTEIPAVITAILSRAPHIKEVKGLGKATYEAAKKSSLMNGKDFDEIVDALYDSGLPQAIDLNQMLYGTWENTKFTLDPTTARRIGDVIANTAKSFGKVGKTIGFTPAEMVNNIGTWLFTLDRFKNNNPKANWRDPENIARITADAWDISHSMIGRAGSMPFQEGALGVLFQFMAVQQKGLMQLLASKTLTKTERAKLAAARLAIYGAYGLPFGVAGMAYLDSYVDNNASDEFRNVYHANKGGVLDALTNTTLDVIHADPGTEWDVVGETFTGKGKSDIAMSKVMSPIPESVPLYDLIKELSKFTDNNQPNPRFPFTAAFGSLGEAVKDVNAIWTASNSDTPEKLLEAARILAEAAPLFNNFTKAQIMREYDDKASKLGQNYGTSVTESEVLMQKFGVTTREEADLWKIKDLERDRSSSISEISNDIFRQFQKMERIVGDDKSFKEQMRRINVLLEFAVSPEDRNEVRQKVEAKIERGIASGTIKESLYEARAREIMNGQNEKTIEMIQLLERSAERNPQDEMVMEMFRNSGLLEKK